jgi:exodeoxyribonuclease V gamma subunit
LLLIYQSTKLNSNNRQDKLLLIDFFIYEIKELLQKKSIFEEIKVIVPNLSMGSWLEKQITIKLGICSGIKFITLKDFIFQIYFNANPNKELFNTHYIKHIIYDYLCDLDANNEHFNEIIDYIFIDGVLNLFKAYSLASQLKIIFEEYIILRTYDIINNKFIDKLPTYQKILWQHIFSYKYSLYQDNLNIVSFIDIYKTFITNPNSLFKYMPNNVLIYGIISIYNSELDIIQVIANYSDIKWYQMVISNKYYSDLYSDATRNKLQAKILKAPFLTLDDLYLIDGNILVANLGQKSREFNELLASRDINIVQLDLLNNNEILNFENESLLALIQFDIYNIINRCDNKYMIYNNLEFYQDPILINNNDMSIKINVCHNKMREVQILFNSICEVIAQDKELNLGDILVIAPDISLYGDYIRAVFNNEYTISYGEKIYLEYSISGVYIPKQDFYQLLELLLNLEYQIPVTYIFDLLNNHIITSILQLSSDDIEQIKYWCQKNNICFGLLNNDYQEYNYSDIPAYSFQELLIRLVLGVTINNGGEVIYLNKDISHIPYKNIDSSKIELINKLGIIFDLCNEIRQLFYKSENILKNFAINDFISIFDGFLKPLITGKEIINSYNEFIKNILLEKIEKIIDLKILRVIIKEIYAKFNTKSNETGKITFTSMQLVKNIPYKMIYVLGLNNGEFPTTLEPNQLSQLNSEWIITDRNINLDDKQNFLSIILSAEKYLYFSYVGYDNISNQKISPSTLLDLFIRVIERSIVDGKNLLEKNIICYHSIYPYINSHDKHSYLSFWNSLQLSSKTNEQRFWNLDKYNEYKIIGDKIDNFIDISYKDFLNTFKYNNYNLSKVIGYNKFKDLIMEEFDDLNFYAPSKILQLEYLFNSYQNYTKEDYYLHAIRSGIISPNNLGDEIFEYTFFIHQEQDNYFKAKYTKKIQLRDNLFITWTIIIDRDGFCCIFDTIKNKYKRRFKLEKEYIKNKSKVVKKINKLINLENEYFLIIEAILSLVFINTLLINEKDLLIDKSFSKVYYDNKIIVINKKDSIDYQVVLDKIISFYYFSLANIVLIDKKIINSYYKKRDLHEAQKELDRKHSNYMSSKNKYVDLIIKDSYREYFYKYDNINNNSIIMLVDILDDFYFNVIEN